jgi:hypothetical protein
MPANTASNILGVHMRTNNSVVISESELRDLAAQGFEPRPSIEPKETLFCHQVYRLLSVKVRFPNYWMAHEGGRTRCGGSFDGAIEAARKLVAEYEAEPDPAMQALLQAGYCIDIRADFEQAAGDSKLVRRARRYPGAFVLWDPYEDGSDAEHGFLLTGDCTSRLAAVAVGILNLDMDARSPFELVVEGTEDLGSVSNPGPVDEIVARRVLAQDKGNTAVYAWLVAQASMPPELDELAGQAFKTACDAFIAVNRSLAAVDRDVSASTISRISALLRSIPPRAFADGVCWSMVLITSQSFLNALRKQPEMSLPINIEECERLIREDRESAGASGHP